MSVTLALLGLSALASSGLGAYASYKTQKSVNAANKAIALQNQAFQASEAQKQRDENRYLSNTAYSRAVKDLQSVGINPYALGTGQSSPVVSTSVPTGAQATMQATNAYTQFANNIASLASSAMYMNAAYNRELSYQKGYLSGWKSGSMANK